MSERWVIVTGANGLVGAEVCRLLLAGGYGVVGLYRSSRGALDELVALYGEKIRPWRFNLLSADEPLPAVGRVDALIHAAVSDLSGKEDPRLNIEMTRTVCLLLQALDIPECVFVSSQNTQFQNRAAYSTSKLMSEEVLAQNFAGRLHVVRPTLIYDHAGNIFLREMVRISGHLKFTPHLGTWPSPSLQPVHVADVARIILLCLLSEQVIHTALYGAEPVTLREVAAAIRAASRALAVIPVPLLALRALALIKPEIADKVKELYEDKTAPSGAVAELEQRFSMKMRSFRRDLPDITRLMAERLGPTAKPWQ
jgi:nucleoside-diphosphate-sugar epimerase